MSDEEPALIAFAREVGQIAFEIVRDFYEAARWIGERVIDLIFTDRARR